MGVDGVRLWRLIQLLGFIFCLLLYIQCTPQWLSRPTVAFKEQAKEKGGEKVVEGAVKCDKSYKSCNRGPLLNNSKEKVVTNGAGKAFHNLMVLVKNRYI